MKTLIISVITSIIIFSPSFLLSQESMDYDVKRVYDKDGNLIYYDSTSAFTVQTDTNTADLDSLIHVWRNEDGGLRYSIQFPNDSFSYSFELPDGFFEYAPEYKFDIEVPEFDSLLKGFDYYFSVTPSDTAKTDTSQSLPNFRFYGTVPEINPDIESKMWEMERRMLELHDRIMNEFDAWEEKNKSRKEDNEYPDEEEKMNREADRSKQIDI